MEHQEATRQEHRARREEMRPSIRRKCALLEPRATKSWQPKLAAKIRANRPERPEPGAFMAELEEILTAEQLTQWEELRQGSKQGKRRGGEKEPDLREILRAAKRLHLDSRQHDKLAEIVRATPANSTGETRRGETATVIATGANRDLAEKTRQIKNRIVEILDPEQRARNSRSYWKGDRSPRSPPRWRSPQRRQQPQRWPAP